MKEKSAQMAADFLAMTSRHQTVPSLILAIKHQEEPTAPDAKLLCDIDLSILGSEDATYREYASATRSEYTWVEEDAYRSRRSTVLNGLLERPFIFALPQAGKVTRSALDSILPASWRP